MIIFSYLNKDDFKYYAFEIFTILNDNMSQITPTVNTLEEDYKVWYEAVKEGLKKVNREIILISLDSESRIIGFFQYYINQDTFMMEEIEIATEYQGKN